jgi:hypothetical protein
MTGSSGGILQDADSSRGTERRDHERLHRSLEDVCDVDKELASDDDHKERESDLEWGVRGVIAQAYAEPSSQHGPVGQQHQDRKLVEASSDVADSTCDAREQNDNQARGDSGL